MAGTIDTVTAIGWWRRLQPVHNGTANSTANWAALARLRRADLLGAMQDPATISPFYNLGASGLGDLPLVALCLGVPASVRNERPEYPAGTR